MKPTVRILGIRGVPAAHGGFETFAERLSLHLVDSGWDVVVYCQHQGAQPNWTDEWKGVRRVNIAVSGNGPGSTVLFDLRSTWHASRHKDTCLVLGYNTAVLCLLLRLRSVPVLINMDGIEWKRGKWGLLPRAWFRLNEWAGCKLAHHLIADHPDIHRHLLAHAPASKISTIPYGADEIREAPAEALSTLGLVPGRFLTVVARPEPENSILEIVQAYSRRARGVPLVVLGKYDSANAYQRMVQAAASSEVRFLGAVYDKPLLQALRFHSLAYVHGHQVGGTNPSLLEALGAGNAVIAHDNCFNRWVAGDAMAYFSDVDEAARIFDELLTDAARLNAMRAAARSRHLQAFVWRSVLGSYTELLSRWQRAGNVIGQGTAA